MFNQTNNLFDFSKLKSHLSTDGSGSIVYSIPWQENVLLCIILILKTNINCCIQKTILGKMLV